MFYDPRTEPHGLAHTPITALVCPRPIGWVTTISKAGTVNLAPYVALAGNPAALVEKVNQVLFFGQMSQDLLQVLLNATQAVSASNPQQRPLGAPSPQCSGRRVVLLFVPAVAEAEHHLSRWLRVELLNGYVAVIGRYGHVHVVAPAGLGRKRDHPQKKAGIHNRLIHDAAVDADPQLRRLT